jgi:hypothetical protein
MDNGTIAVLMTSILTFLSVLAKMFYDAYMEARHRQWAIEDQARAADANSRHTDKIMAAIADNTQVSTQAAGKADLAYKEANTVNQKLAVSGVKLVDAKGVIMHDPQQ